MLCKDFLRIGSLCAAIGLGLLAHSKPPQADSWAERINVIKPVQVETVTLPEPVALRV
jgi:hypothetical protein